MNGCRSAGYSPRVLQEEILAACLGGAGDTVANTVLASMAARVGDVCHGNYGGGHQGRSCPPKERQAISRGLGRMFSKSSPDLGPPADQAGLPTDWSDHPPAWLRQLF